MGTAKWYSQPVQPGKEGLPSNTRDICAVAAYASDGSSIILYSYGGIVYDNSKQRPTQTSEIWILFIPAFVWRPSRGGR
ncbi:hypothetical protein TWF694_010610 [Orbilia ellipsospora]|uniref:Uncharacterized protein n=1 Tax=Orbilia ellipsospora TaxID=2528407 RepID=A0AAV9XBJ7_9PEZI